MSDNIRWKWVPAALIWFLLVAILWQFGWLAGFVLGSLHAWRGNFILDMEYEDQYGETPYVWESAFMRRWFQTTDNGALPMWYIARVKDKGWSLKRALWDFCVIRNGFGGNPWNMRNFPGDEVLFKSDSGSCSRLSARFAYGFYEGKWMYLITQSKYQPWKMGVWLLREMKPTKKKPYRHFEIRHGFKFYPDREMADARFSVWDTGVRS